MVKQIGLTCEFEAEKLSFPEIPAFQYARTLEEELNNRWSLVVKLRKYTLDQLMSEYKRLTGSLRPEQEETNENAET